VRPAAILSGPSTLADTEAIKAKLFESAADAKADISIVAASLQVSEEELTCFIHDNFGVSWVTFQRAAVQAMWHESRMAVIRAARSGDLKAISQLLAQVEREENQHDCPASGSCPCCPFCRSLRTMTDEQLRLKRQQPSNVIAASGTIEQKLQRPPGSLGAYASIPHIKIKPIDDTLPAADSEKPTLERSLPEGSNGRSAEPTSNKPVVAGLPKPLVAEVTLFTTDVLLPTGEPHE